ncbi:MAG: hypothetical protein GY737_00400 [Desulfobacteraceae bacterium]|nr:hypothetical protein [Desulfobacteraceae bacterium]
MPIIPPDKPDPAAVYDTTPEFDLPPTVDLPLEPGVDPPGDTPIDLHPDATKRVHLKGYQKDALATYVAMGFPTTTIAELLGVKESQIQRFIAKKSPVFIEQVEIESEALMRAKTRFNIETAGIFDDAITSLKETVNQTENWPTKFEATKEVLAIHGATFPREERMQTAQAANQAPQLNIYTDNRTVTAYQETMESLAEVRPSMTKLAPVGELLDGPHTTVSAKDKTREEVEDTLEGSEDV